MVVGITDAFVVAVVVVERETVLDVNEIFLVVAVVAEEAGFGDVPVGAVETGAEVVSAGLVFTDETVTGGATAALRGGVVEGGVTTGGSWGGTVISALCEEADGGTFDRLGGAPVLDKALFGGTL